ncbi:MAG: hypothetical protein IPM18_12110 [Phycisphaerales bacterium]|nr:hypothetical protein [Phycisphaerales bacterium]
MMRMRRMQAAVALCAVSALTIAAQADSPVGRAFTYQGELAQGGVPVHGNCDFQFRLWDAAVGGLQVGAMHALDNVAVVSGRVTVLLNDADQFGASPFDGKARFLEIAVRSPSGAGVFTTLSPRQELTPAPYASGLSLPFLGVSDDNLGSVFEIVNNDLGWAGVFRNNNPANTDATLNVTSMGGPAGQFLNDGGGLALSATAIGTADAVSAESFSGRAVYARILSAAAPAPATAVRALNLSLQPGTTGVWATSAGSGTGVHGQSLSGRAVFGETLSDFGFGVYGSGGGLMGIGVYGIHPALVGDAPGVDGVTNSASDGAAGVRGRATSDHTAGTRTYGVLGTSAAFMGVGVRGQGRTGVEGIGQNRGVFATASNTGGHGVRAEATYGVWGLGNDGGAGVVGEAGNGSTYGVWAIGAGGRLNQPALRADGGNGPAVYAIGGRAIEGEGTEFGVRGITWSPTGVGGTFANPGGGTALHVDGRAEVDGTLSVNVLEIMGGADLAERFEFDEEAEAGMVVEIDPDQPGKLRVSRTAYNKRVAGVISGANDLQAGIVLGDGPAGERHRPVAMSGRVWVRCDTRMQGVEPGDLLTTSDLAGFAKPVGNRAQADGAIIGKAMSRLPQGEDGLVLVLVNLQ